MNSFNTDEDTEKIVRKYQGFKVQIYTFNQSCFPRISRESFLPVAKDFDVNSDIEAWYPPGHGDFYESFQKSGLLKQFIGEGREYLFLSNIDNLGATVDLNILNMLLTNSKPNEFVMEVTDKTRADVKGGTIIQLEDQLRLLEIAQVPNDHVDDFKSVKTFKFFNTNNIWANLKGECFSGFLDKFIFMNIFQQSIEFSPTNHSTWRSSLTTKLWKTVFVLFSWKQLWERL